LAVSPGVPRRSAPKPARHGREIGGVTWADRPRSTGPQDRVLARIARLRRVQLALTRRTPARPVDSLLRLRTRSMVAGDGRPDDTGRLGFWTRRCLLVALAALAGGAAAAAAAPPASAASGSLLWSRGIQITPQREDFSDLARGPGGTVYGTGMSGGSQGSGDYLVAKYSPAGERRWRRVRDLGPNDTVAGMALDACRGASSRRRPALS
jgi:hypothetical protein